MKLSKLQLPLSLLSAVMRRELMSGICHLLYVTVPNKLCCSVMKHCTVSLVFFFFLFRCVIMKYLYKFRMLGKMLMLHFLY